MQRKIPLRLEEWKRTDLTNDPAWGNEPSRPRMLDVPPDEEIRTEILRQLDAIARHQKAPDNELMKLFDVVPIVVLRGIEVGDGLQQELRIKVPEDCETEAYDYTIAAETAFTPDLFHRHLSRHDASAPPSRPAQLQIHYTGERRRLSRTVWAFDRDVLPVETAHLERFYQQHGERLSGKVAGEKLRKVMEYVRWCINTFGPETGIQGYQTFQNPTLKLISRIINSFRTNFYQATVGSSEHYFGDHSQFPLFKQLMDEILSDESFGGRVIEHDWEPHDVVVSHRILLHGRRAAPNDKINKGGDLFGRPYFNRNMLES